MLKMARFIVAFEEAVSRMSQLKILHIYEDDFSPEKSWQLLEWCLSRGADEFTIASCIYSENTPPTVCDDLFQALSPFDCGVEGRDTLRSLRPEVITLRTLCPESITVLRAYFEEGLFTYIVRDEGTPEDPMFYRAGKLMLGIITHEGEGILHITETEHEIINRMGFTAHTSPLRLPYLHSVVLSD